MQFVQAIDGQIGQLFRVDFDAAAGGGFETIGDAGGVAFDGTGGGIEQERPDGRAADVETYNVEVAGCLGHFT